MSSIHLSLHAYDVLDRVQITLRVAEVFDDPRESIIWNVVLSEAIDGHGETDRAQWVRDVLVAALEAT